jgi:hypothetical protein
MPKSTRLVRIAKGLRRRKRGNSLRAIAAELAARGYVNANGRSTQRPRWPRCSAPEQSARFRLERRWLERRDHAGSLP